MAEQPLIVTDPISSDGSEDSWILLDEMDEAMNEVDGVVNESTVEAVPITTVPEISIETAEVATETYQPLQIEEIHDNDDVNGNDFGSKIETISSDLIDTCPSDDSSASEHMYSSRPYDHVSLAPTTIDDGSTTDGSISMISDTEFQRYETKPKRKLSKDGKNQLDMLMNCRPIDMTVKNPRPTVQIRGRCAMPASIEELAMGKPSLIDEVIHFLERLNHFFATTYLGQVLLLFVTIISLTSYSIMYYRYTAIKLELNELNRQYLDSEVRLMETDVKLASCEYTRYSRELKINNNNEPNVPKSIVTEEDPKMSATNIETNYYKLSDHTRQNVERENEDIHPTKITVQYRTEPAIDKTETISTFDLNDNDNFEEDLVIPSIRDDHGRVVWIGDDEPELPPETMSKFRNFDDINDFEFFGSMLSEIMNKGVDNRDIDTQTTIKNEPTEEDTLCENDCNSDDIQKYIQNAPIHHTATIQRQSMDESKSRKEEKKIAKTKTKWEKSEMKYNDHADKYHSSEENFAEKKEKNRRDKKHRKDNDKENKNDNNKDRKEFKGKKDKHDKDTHDSGKWNVANTYEHRFDD